MYSQYVVASLFYESQDNDGSIKVKVHWWGLELALDEAGMAWLNRGIGVEIGIVTILSTAVSVIPAAGLIVGAIGIMFAAALGVELIVWNALDKGNGLRFCWAWPQLLNAALIQFPVPLPL